MRAYSLRCNDGSPGGTSNPDPNLDRTYEYDPIGNRTLSRRGTDPNSTYARNNVNQYESITTALSPIETVQELKYDPDGNLTEALTLGDVDGDGDVDQDDIDAVLFAYGTCEGDESYNPRANFDATATCDGDPNLQTIDQDDLDVVLFYFGLPSTGSIRAKLAWDGENRLSSWEALVPGAGSKKVTFKYDYMGRRSEKAVYDWDPNLNSGDGGWSVSPSTLRRYVWSDWLRLMELDGSGNVLRKWTWGRDLSGLTGGLGGLGGMGVSPVDGAGGIGGLLAVRDANDTPSDPNDDLKYVYFYDANGNVGQVVDLFGTGSPSGVIKARYEYDAYGNVTYSAGSYASTNAVRFSTKPWDDETGMGDWGRRYYDPRLGRWASNDPVGDAGGNNLYASCANRPTTVLDPIGLQFTPHTWPPPNEPASGPAASSGSCTCTVEVKASGLHLYLSFSQTGCGPGRDFSGTAHWGPCGLAGMCPCGTLNGVPNSPQPCFGGLSDPGWGDTGGPAKGGGGPQAFVACKDGTPGTATQPCTQPTKPCDDRTPCDCLRDLMTRKYPVYILLGPNSNSAAMQAARECGISTSGVTGYPGQGVHPGRGEVLY